MITKVITISITTFWIIRKGYTMSTITEFTKAGKNTKTFANIFYNNVWNFAKPLVNHSIYFIRMVHYLRILIKLNFIKPILQSPWKMECTIETVTYPLPFVSDLGRKVILMKITANMIVYFPSLLNLRD